MNKALDLTRETLKGKSFYRLLFNWQVEKYCRGLTGIAVDLACGGKSPSYHRYWQTDFTKLIRIDLSPESEPDIAADLNKGIPLEDNYADNVFMFNSLYLIEDQLKLVKEIKRVLKPGGRAFVTTQFVKSEESQAPDRYRLTSRQTREIFNQAGFKNLKIHKIGECFSAAGNLTDFALGSSAVARLFKIFYRPFCLFADYILPTKLKENYPCPIAWLVIATKTYD